MRSCSASTFFLTEPLSPIFPTRWRPKRLPGFESEQLAVDSIARTLEANLPAAHRLKILIHGQEVETLAGHADLTGLFDLNPPVLRATAPRQQ